MEGLKDFVNNNREIIVILMVIYILGFIHRLVKNIRKEKHNKKDY